MTPRTIALPTANDGAKLRSMVGAVIYIRVSTKEQTDNLSLPTQLRACEEYCRREGFEILERFKEEGESAKTADRTELQRLLKFCRTNKGKVHFVVVFNLTRFARDKFDHFALRSHLKSLGISLRSATEPIDDTSTGKLMEGVLASFAQFDNGVRWIAPARGCRRLLSGPMDIPRPHRLPQRPARDRQEPHAGPRAAPLVRRDSRIRDRTIHKARTPQEVKSLGLDQPALPSAHIASDRHAAANHLYAGIVDVPEYGVRGKRGDFEPLISEDLFYRAQRYYPAGSRATQSGAPARISHYAPLCDAGPVVWACAGSWSERSRRPTSPTTTAVRAITQSTSRRTSLEGLFADELALLQPTPGYMGLAKEIRAADLENAGRPLYNNGASRTPSGLPKQSRRSWTAWTKRYSSNVEST